MALINQTILTLFVKHGGESLFKAAGQNGLEYNRSSGHAEFVITLTQKGRDPYRQGSTEPLIRISRQDPYISKV